MPTAREALQTNLAALRGAVTATSLLQSDPPDPVTDESARLARNGLAVVGFAVLEEFIRARGAELAAAASAVASFSSMPTNLRDAVTTRVVVNLSTQLGLLRDNEGARVHLLGQTGIELSSIGGSQLAVSPLAFGWAGSNLQSDDLRRLLQALQVEKPWETLTILIQRFGFTTLKDAAQSFRAIQNRRNRAAHDASENTDLISIRALPRDVLALALGFDAAASLGVQQMRALHSSFFKDHIPPALLKVRYLRYHGSYIAEFREGNQRATARHASEQTAISAAVTRARGNGELLVLQSRDGEPFDWRTPF